jgi:hypothetical protein
LATALKGNQVITELNIASNDLWRNGSAHDISGIVALSDAISGMRALSKLDTSDNSMFGFSDKTGITAWAAALKACTSITELSFAKNDMDGGDAKILADIIPDMGALSKLDVCGNHIPPVEMALLKGACDAKGVSLGFVVEGVETSHALESPDTDQYARRRAGSVETL